MDDFSTIVEHMALVLARAPQRLARELDGAEPLTTGWTAATSEPHRVLFESRHGTEEGWRPMPRDLSRPVRSALLHDLWESDDPNKISRAQFAAFAVRVATKHDLRSVGRVPFISPHPHLCATIGVVYAADRGNEWTHHFASYHQREQRWIQWGQGYTRMQRDRDHQWFDDRVGLALSMQFTQRYDWRVYLGYGTGARVSLATTPQAARKLFRARDLPAGKERRAALRHWVTEHYRRVEKPRPTPVRSHLRGAENFDWNGLQCQIEPSEYDRDRVGKLPA